MKRLDIAVAGAGAIGRRHLQLVLASDACQPCAIVDPSPAAAALAVSCGVPLFAGLGEMLATRRPDGVILATPNALHVEQALQCLDAGVPALIEKPVAHSLDDGERLLAAVDRSPVRMLVGHHRAHSPILAQARALIRQGLLGDLVAVNGSAVFHKDDDYFERAPWRRRAGGGPILINLVHEIGNLRSLCGEITAVQAMASHATRRFEVEDTVAINLRFASGALGTFLLSDAAACTRSWEQTSQEDPSYPSDADEDCYVVSGTRGTLSIPTMRLKRHGDGVASSWKTPFETVTFEVERDDPLACQLAHFCDVIEGRAEPLVSVRDGLQNLRVVDAIRRAAGSASLIELDGT